LRIRVLIQMRTIEPGEPVTIGREMRWHPVQNHSESLLMKVVDEVHEVLRRAVAGCRRKIARGLISPGTVEGMLCDRHELDMREGKIAQVFGQSMRKLAVIQELAVLAAP